MRSSQVDHTMWTWLADNHAIIASMASVLTLVVWALYLHLILGSYRRQRRPKILINRGAGFTVDARCVVTNMSAEAIYIDAVLLRLRAAGEDFETFLSDRRISSDVDGDPRSHWFQGPIASGELVDLGTFQHLMKSALESLVDTEGDAAPEIDHVGCVTFLVIGLYTGRDGIVAAERSFDIVSRHGLRLLRPHTVDARQIRGRRERRRLERMMVARYARRRTSS